jgi:serine/threonine protein phosphatase PrpC
MPQSVDTPQQMQYSLQSVDTPQQMQYSPALQSVEAPQQTMAPSVEGLQQAQRRPSRVVTRGASACLLNQDRPLENLGTAPLGTAPLGTSPLGPAPSPSSGTAQIRFEYGEHVTDGYKKGQPDQVGQDLVMVQPVGELLVVAVFDGHGKHGLKVAKQTRELFQESASSIASWAPGQLTSRFTELFRQAQSTFEQDKAAAASGTTATIAVLSPVSQAVTFAHVGDSSAIIGIGTNLKFSTKDHDFDEADKERVDKCGGEIREFPTKEKTVRRIYGKGTNYPALALSRSLGDTDAHRYGVLDEPEVSENVPFKLGHLLVMASDGVWNVVSKDSVLNVATVGSAADAAERVVECARNSWPSTGTDYIDDISCIVIKAMPNLQAEPQQQAPQPSPQLSTVTQPLGLTGKFQFGNQQQAPQQSPQLSTVTQPLGLTGKFQFGDQQAAPQQPLQQQLQTQPLGKTGKFQFGDIQAPSSQHMVSTQPSGSYRERSVSQPLPAHMVRGGALPNFGASPGDVGGDMLGASRRPPAAQGLLIAIQQTT